MCEHNYSGTYCQECAKNEWKLHSSCDHDFRFSHIEYPATGTYSAIPPNKEVVVCRKCGEIRKFIQQY